MRCVVLFIWKRNPSSTLVNTPKLSDEQQIRQLANLELLARQVVEGL